MHRAEQPASMILLLIALGGLGNAGCSASDETSNPGPGAGDAGTDATTEDASGAETSGADVAGEATTDTFVVGGDGASASDAFDAGPFDAAADVAPAMQTIQGRVVESALLPIAGATVRIGDATTTTDATGAFSVQIAPGPYEARVLVNGDAGHRVAVVYRDVTRADPTLTIPIPFDAIHGDQYRADTRPVISGSFSAIPGAQGNESVAMRCLEHPNGGAVVDVSARTFSGLELRMLKGKALDEVTIMAIASRGSGATTQYVGFGSAKVAIDYDVPTVALSQPIAIGAASTLDLTGNITALPTGSSVFPFAHGYSTTVLDFRFNGIVNVNKNVALGAFTLPPLPHATGFHHGVWVSARGSYWHVAWEGSTPPAALSNIALPREPTLDSPADGASGVGPGTVFSATPAEANSFLLSNVRYGTVDIWVSSSSTSWTLPSPTSLGLPEPTAGTMVTWSATQYPGSYPDTATRPQGFTAEYESVPRGQPFVSARSATRKFTW